MYPHRDFDPYDESLNLQTEKHQGILTNPILPKAQFIPSKHEARMIMKFVHSLRNGWIRDPTLPKEDKETERTFDLWGDEPVDENARHFVRLPPPKPRLPGHAESFNPPAEYLYTPAELEKQMALDPEERQYNFIPSKYDSLRQVPEYRDLIRERFQRNLDLYLCVRVRRRERLNISAESLIPHLPKPKDLRPFPTTLSLEYLGHTKSVRSIDVDPTGQWLVSGSDDHTVRVWEVATARCLRVWNMDEPVVAVAWNPNPSTAVLAVALDSGLVLLNAGTGSRAECDATNSLLGQAPKTYRDGLKLSSASKSTAANVSAGKVGKTLDKMRKMQKLVTWMTWRRRLEFMASPSKYAASEAARDEEELKEAQKKKQREGAGSKRKAGSDGEEEEEEEEAGAGGGDDAEEDNDPNADDQVRGLARVFLKIDEGVSSVSWHSKGDYFCTVSPVATSTAVVVHRLTKAASQLPFAKSKGHIQKACFHPTQPLFLVATQHHVKIYNLAEQRLVKTLSSSSKWISSIAVHPQGDHVVIGGYDRRVCWFDLDLSSSPYKTLRYHRRGVRSVAFHPRFPLLATASDDGCIHIVHNTVYTDLVTNPMLVPVKIINAHIPVNDIGVMQTVFHPHQPWIFSCSADKSIRLFS